MPADYPDVKEQINALVNVASLSVHRVSTDDNDEEEVFRTSPKMSHKPMVDKRLERLSSDLTAYQLSLAEKEKEVSSKFQKDVLTSMLFEEKFDSIDFAEASKTELTKEKIQLTKAYKDLGAFDQLVKKRIEKHFDELNQSIANINRYVSQPDDIEPDDRYFLDIESLIPLPFAEKNPTTSLICP